MQQDPTASKTKKRLRTVCTGAPEVSCSWRDALKEQREQGTACFPRPAHGFVSQAVEALSVPSGRCKLVDFQEG